MVLSNCSNNYGPSFIFHEKLIPLVILLMPWMKSRCRIYRQGVRLADWLYVDDHAAGLKLVATPGVSGKSYAIGGRAEPPQHRRRPDHLPDAGYETAKAIVARAISN